MNASPSDGPRNAETDDNGIRRYTWMGQKVPSTTSLRRLVGVPFPLANWQVGQVVMAAVSNSSNLDSMVAREGAEAAAKWLRKTGMSERDAAANRGTAVHKAAEKKVPVGDATAEVAGPLAQYYDFLAKTKARELMSERQVWNLDLRYAGSLDAMFEFPIDCAYKELRGRKPIVDLKTGKGLYLDHALQQIGYAMAEFVGDDDVIDPTATGLLHSADGLMLLHLSDTSWELVEIKASPRLFDVFRAMCLFAHWQDETTLEDLIVRRIKP